LHPFTEISLVYRRNYIITKPSPDFANSIATFMKLKTDNESSALNPVIPSILLKLEEQNTANSS
jgi:hypothetical protein